MTVQIEKRFRKQNQQKRVNSWCGLESQAYLSLLNPSIIIRMELWNKSGKYLGIYNVR